VYGGGGEASCDPPFAYGAANALLYSALLPLWEGFDEPFHFGYVQHLANGQGLPDARVDVLSREIGASLTIAPASGLVRVNLPEIKTTFSEYFSLTPVQRASIHDQLRTVPPEWRWQGSHFGNYEAQQAPLAYFLLALPERALAGVPLPGRVLVLRIIGAFAGTLLVYFGAERLFRELGLREPYKSAAIFCIFSCQMTWATIAHVANDWLAVPFAVWSLTLTIRYWRNPNVRTAAWVGGVLALGLLTKAYFIAFIPMALVLGRRFKDLCLSAAIIVLAAGPWYLRNVLRYGAVTGLQESRAGIGLSAVVHAAPAFHWPTVIWGSIRAALWTGNNTFMAFSANTLTAIVAAWLIALILWAVSRHRSAEWITVLHCALFLAALAYNAVERSIYAGGVAGTIPWYPQAILTPMLGLAFLGCSRSDRVGRIAAGALVGLFGYVLIATYVVKLIPLYGGYEGRTSLSAVMGLYSSRLPFLADNLNMLTLAPAVVLLSLTGIVVVLAVVQVIIFTRSVFETPCPIN